MQQTIPMEATAKTYICQAHQQLLEQASSIYDAHALRSACCRIRYLESKLAKGEADNRQLTADVERTAKRVCASCGQPGFRGSECPYETPPGSEDDHDDDDAEHDNEDDDDDEHDDRYVVAPDTGTEVAVNEAYEDSEEEEPFWSRRSRSTATCTSSSRSRRYRQ